MNRYEVEYHAATYSGTRTVVADDSDAAIAMVRHWVRREMTLPMYSDSYKVISSECIDEENENS